MIIKKERERVIRLLAARIYPKYDDVRENTFSGVAPAVSGIYKELYGKKVEANSVPLNTDNPRFYLEITEKGECFLATAHRYRHFLNGYGKVFGSTTHSLLPLSPDYDEIVCQCLQIIIKARKV